MSQNAKNAAAIIIVFIVIAVIYQVHEAYVRTDIHELGKLARVTAYCPCPKCCGKWSDGYTANGYKIQKGDVFVAAPKEIPFGTMLIVPNYNQGQPVEVKDRGGAIKLDRLDVYFDDHQTALEWGIQFCKVEIVE